MPLGAVMTNFVVPVAQAMLISLLDVYHASVRLSRSPSMLKIALAVVLAEPVRFVVIVALPNEPPPEIHVAIASAIVYAF